MVSMLSSLFLAVAGGMFCQDFDYLLLVPRDPCERQFLVDRVVFPTDYPLGSKGGLIFL